MSKRTHRSWFGGLLVVALLAAGGMATIASAEVLDEADPDDSVIEFEYVEDEGLLIYWLTDDAPVDDDGNPVDCVAAATADDDSEPPEACRVVEVTGPNGQINHGTVVSSFVHSIKDLDYDGPRGHLVRELAKSDLPPENVKAGDDDGLDLDDDDDDDDDEPKADKEKKEKKEKPEGHPGRGHGRK